MAIERYVVPGVPLIPQSHTYACWYASAQMLIQWRRGTRLKTEGRLPDPSEVPSEVARHKANNGLDFSVMLEFARRMGLRAVPLMSPRMETIADWLWQYGPIWTAGDKQRSDGSTYGHVVVIAGIATGQLFVHDPEPLHQGTAEWKPESWLPATIQDAQAAVVTNFLHCP